jgi:alkanesulfonate monooxygenase SsuD/methylene tetrahydromethanopterin reductase-like flavin-dependent oxidoreductase (luciferase family)
VPSAKSALLRAQGLSASDFAATVAGLRAGKSAAEMLDDRFLAAFTIAGTAEDCLAQARAYLEAGATELVLSFAGPQPEQDMQYLGSALTG